MTGSGDDGGAAARDGAAGGSGGSGAPDASTPDAGTPADAALDAGPIEPADSGFDAGALLVDTCEPLLTPVPVFFVASGGEGTVAGWEKPDLAGTTTGW